MCWCIERFIEIKINLLRRLSLWRTERSENLKKRENVLVFSNRSKQPNRHTFNQYTVQNIDSVEEKSNIKSIAFLKSGLAN